MKQPGDLVFYRDSPGWDVGVITEVVPEDPDGFCYWVIWPDLEEMQHHPEQLGSVTLSEYL